METIRVISKEKKERYEELLPQLTALICDEKDVIALLANTTAALKSTFSYYSWVGFYLLKDAELVLGPFQGKVACFRIQKGKGVCGASIEKRETIIVPDVRQFSGYICCDPDSKSEIVVPLVHNGTPLGVLDVDSDDVGGFDEIDQVYLEKIADLLIQKF